MSYQGFENGLYLASRQVNKAGGLLKHAGVIDIGNVLQHPDFDERFPVLYHQTVSGLIAERLIGSWGDLQAIVDIEGAYERLLYAAENPEYNLFENNCEHFANFMATGQKFSGQLRGVSVLALLAGFLWWASTTTENGRKF